jgi:hypothetical protein
VDRDLFLGWATLRGRLIGLNINGAVYIKQDRVKGPMELEVGQLERTSALQEGITMSRKLCLLIALALAFEGSFVNAQNGAGKIFGARDPRTCSSRKAGLSASQARQYLICDIEGVSNPNSESPGLTLVTDVTVEVGKGRPFNDLSDTFGFATTNGIDPSETVFPIRGSLNSWNCVKLGAIGGDAGKNCVKWPGPAMTGICFKSSFGDWHCMMSGLQYPGMERYPPPAGQ